MNNLTLTLLLSFFSLTLLSQNNSPTLQSNSSLDFGRFLSGVKFAEVVTSPEQEKLMIAYPQSASIHLGITSFLESMGFEEVGFSAKFRDRQLASECEKTNVIVTYNVKGDFIEDFSIGFLTCNLDYFIFKKDKRIRIGFSDIQSKIHRACIELYGYKKNNYNTLNRLKLKGESSNFTENNLKEYYNSNRIDAIEGIYENITTKNQPKYKIGVKKSISGYDLIYLSGANNYLDWTNGDIKARLSATATPTLFKADWFMAAKVKNNNFLVSFEQGIMNVIDEDKDKDTYIKLYPTVNSISSSSSVASSGTGFAISEKGYIVTNFHVIDGAKSIKVRGINGDFNKTYNATVSISDKNNDLAILKVSDSETYSLGVIPFNLATSGNDVGTSVFVLGFPLRATMGDEVKLTNGIISSKSGFQGDITSYQISAPVQPGNSGGPLLNQNGELIGIINAKHVGAENVSYAIKCNYLNNLIEQLPIEIILKSQSLNNKILSEQVKIVKNFIYIVEVN